MTSSGGATPPLTLTERLRLSRTRAGLSQAQIGDELGVARATVGTYETGHVVPSRAVLIAWAALCGVDFGWLAGFPKSRGVSRDTRGRLIALQALAAFAVPAVSAIAQVAS